MRTLSVVSSIKYQVLIFLLMTSFVSSFAQGQHDALSKQGFEASMESYIVQYISDTDHIDRIKSAKDMFEEGDVPSSSDIESILKEEAKSKYIRDHRKNYRDLYFLQSFTMMTTDTFVCDNGGFEDDFEFYNAYTTRYTHGSDSCDLTYAGQPVIWTEENVLPVQNRFQIVNSGIDPVFGITKTKFGNKAIQLNSMHGDASPTQCWRARGVDKLVKRFKVTQENRDFTIWYAVMIDNPGGHINQQPFLNIKCDRAPNNELCFDADIIPCDENFSIPPNCGTSAVDVLDWACHRFKIPVGFIDSIATLEIIIGDCGQGGHFGMAYIDGICEECTESSLGSITLYEGDIDNGVGINYSSCQGLNATVCGSYTTPTICGVWDSLIVSIDGYTISNVQIDTSTKTFCFDFPITNFGTEDCIEFYVEVLFTSNVFQDLPIQYSNNVEICRSKFQTYDYTVFVSPCLDNSTSPQISDDHYFVELNLDSFPNSSTWSIQRQLLNPYPNESGSHTIADGTGKEYLNLGPFLIQEGDWYLFIEVDGCIYYELIQAPDYCSGCSLFNNIEIYDIQCIANITSDPSDDEWDFKVLVPGPGGASIQPYIVTSAFTNNNGFTGSPTDIDEIDISHGCVDFTITTMINNQDCISTFTVCPPKPCDNEPSCDLEVYVKDVICTKGANNFEIELDIDATLSQGQFICYKTENVDPLGTGSTMQGAGLPSQNIFGPFTESVFLTVYICDYPSTCLTCASNSRCFKTIYIPKLECNDRRFNLEKSPEIISYGLGIKKSEFVVFPNPVLTNEFTLRSSLEHTDFELYDLNGKILFNGAFDTPEFNLSLDIKSGIYFIKYFDAELQPQVVKLIKI